MYQQAEPRRKPSRCHDRPSCFAHARLSFGISLLAIGLFIWGAPPVHAQTCGCAEAPLMSSFDTAATPAGSWTYLAPGLNLKINDKLSVRFSAQIPVHRDLNGTQLTNSLTTSLSLFYRLK